MSPKNADTVRLAREVLEGLGRRDAERLIALSHPNVEWYSFFALGEAGAYRGHDGTRRYMSDLSDAFRVGYAEVDEALGVGDVALLVGRIRYRGEGSGVESAASAGWVLEFRGGELLRFWAFRDPEQALKALGRRGAPAAAADNTEIVRRVYEAAARGDTAAVFALYHPDIEWDASRTQRGALTGRVVRGHAALRAWLREWYQSWETVNDDLEQAIAADEHTVVTIMVQRGRGKARGVDVENRLGAVWAFRDGRIVRVMWFESPEAALEAAGLRG